VIASLTGEVVAAHLGEVVVDVGGVGYRVLTPPSASMTRTGQSVTLHTHLSVREDALTLYGFAEAGSRDVFATLLSATGVGPKVALATLDTLGVEGLRRAVAAEDAQALTAVPGIGAKGARRILLELGERLSGDGETAVAASAGDTEGEVRKALLGLGYSADEARRAMTAAGNEGDAPDSAEELLRAALRTLGR
jgi:Holliday junction DNA helicase RuvA